MLIMIDLGQGQEEWWGGGMTWLILFFLLGYGDLLDTYKILSAFVCILAEFDITD